MTHVDDRVVSLLAARSARVPGARRRTVRHIPDQTAACGTALPKVSQDWFFQEVLKRLKPATRLRRTMKPVTLSNMELERRVDGLLREVLSGQTLAAQRTMTLLSDHGLSETSLCIDVLSAVAGRLGAMWTRDEIDVHDTAAACGQLELLFNRLKKQAPQHLGNSDPRKSLILCRSAGEHHNFGLLMVEHFFRRSGWHVSGGIDLELGPACFACVSKDWFALAGVSVGRKDSIAQATDRIGELRRTSKNPELLVMAGGPVFADGTLTASDLGART